MSGNFDRAMSPLALPSRTNTRSGKISRVICLGWCWRCCSRRRRFTWSTRI